MFHKYTKIKALGDNENEGILTMPGKVVIQEKYDGANFAFYVEDDVLYFCSHNQNLTDSDQIKKTGIPKGWEGIKPILDMWYRQPHMFSKYLYYYGENCNKHTIRYDEDHPKFIGFDILDLRTMELWDWESAKIEFGFLNLPFIHIIEEKDVETITVGYLDTLYRKSAYRDGKAEGIVIKRYDIKNKYDRPHFAKIVDDEFKEQNKALFGGSSEPRKLNNGDKIAELYGTSGRIKKMIHKMSDEGHEIRMELMRELFGRVVEDILEEEIKTIYKDFDSINFKELNKAVSKRCPKVLKQVMMNG